MEQIYQHQPNIVGHLPGQPMMNFLTNLDNLTYKPKFELIKPIGKGQFSDVYKAKWLNSSSCNTTPIAKPVLDSCGHSNGSGQLFKTLPQDKDKDLHLHNTNHTGTRAIRHKKITTSKGTTNKKFKSNHKDADCQIVALKRVKIFDMKDAKSRVDCLREINLLQKLDHPNIIRYSLSFIDKNDLFIVLELADGGDLSKLIRHFLKQHQLLTEKTVLKYFTQICSAVKYIHSRSVLHRDIKPANIFMTSSGCVKLGDFGLGRYFSPQTMDAHSLVGTFYYMAPERIRQSGYGFSSDVWSVGCVLYELMALRPPFCAGYQYDDYQPDRIMIQPNHYLESNNRGDMINLQDLIDRINNGHFLPIEANFSSKLKELIGHCLNPQPELRPKMDEICLVVDSLYEEQLTLMKSLASTN